jgi:hypothetical protein
LEIERGKSKITLECHDQQPSPPNYHTKSRLLRCEEEKMRRLRTASQCEQGSEDICLHRFVYFFLWSSPVSWRPCPRRKRYSVHNSVPVPNKERITPALHIIPTEIITSHRTSALSDLGTRVNHAAIKDCKEGLWPAVNPFCRPSSTVSSWTTPYITSLEHINHEDSEAVKNIRDDPYRRYGIKTGKYKNG